MHQIYIGLFNKGCTNNAEKKINTNRSKIINLESEIGTQISRQRFSIGEEDVTLDSRRGRLEKLRNAHLNPFVTQLSVTSSVRW